MAAMSRSYLPASSMPPRLQSQQSSELVDSDSAEWDSDHEADTDAQQQLGEWLGQLQVLSDQATDHSTVPAHSAHVVHPHHPHQQPRHQPHHEQSTSLGVRTGSPDADSAFGDGASMLSNESSTHRSRDSNVSSADSSRGSLNTPSPTQQNVDSSSNTVTLLPVQESDGSKDEPSEASRLKADKIKQALEKMKEANIKKLYVKFFTSDGGSKSLLVDERSTVSHVLRQLAEKHRITLNTNYAVVEQYPDLFMERIYEDQEHLVENILMWTRDSSNKLLFIERLDKYPFIDEPQEYLVGETERHAKLDQSRKQQILEEFFAPAHVQPPEVEGWLYLKADGKKAWKKHYFVLRPSGLYYTPKGKSKSSKDLVCLMNLEMNQVYNSLGWRRKYKAPTEFGFAIKHPQIQVKASKYIKYLCAEDESSYRRWMVALRIAKSNRQLYENYEAMKTFLESDEGKSASDGMRNSASAENCFNGDGASVYSRESVVIRPKSIVSNYSDSEVKMRPKSADINGRVSGQKRNSGLLRVDLPTIPDGECATSYSEQPPASVSHQPPYVSANAVYARGSGSQTPTSQYSGDGQQLVFEQSDAMTGTIKRQPLEHNRQSNSLIPMHQRRQSTEGAGSVSSGKESGGADLDSDEELFPPPPPPIAVEVVSIESETNGMPPPPTELSAPVVGAQPSTAGKKRAPPPPRRSENTRLTTAPAAAAPPPSQVSPNARAPSRGPPPPVATKPTAIGGGGGAGSGDFQSELQRAMAKRLQKVNESATVVEGQGRGGAPAPPPKRVSANGAV